MRVSKKDNSSLNDGVHLINFSKFVTLVINRTISK